jgi:hypothetical protein
MLLEEFMLRRISNALTVVLLLSGALSFAQNTNSGDIRGTVTDPTGAVISGVTVTVKDVDKGVVKTFTTNDGGLYDTGSIVPDHYLITLLKKVSPHSSVVPLRSTFPFRQSMDN